MKEKDDPHVSKNTLISAGEMVEAEGYLFVDSKKCTGCCSCMLACSLIHEGRPNLSLSRIQVIDQPFSTYPNDIEIATCRQCLVPQCMVACPTGSLSIDKSNKNVRAINEDTCIGCRSCLNACPFTPSRILFNPDKGIAVKCDLCRSPRYWPHKGEPMCVQVCPVKAITFSKHKPGPIGGDGYNINLRGKGWEDLGLSKD